MTTSAAFRPEWVEPIGVDYRGCTVWELPPNGHGLVVLEALGILAGMPRLDGSAGSVHRAIEAMKLAYADGKRYIAERGAMEFASEAFLDAGYLASRRALIGKEALIARARLAGLRRHRLLLAPPTARGTWSAGYSPTTRTSAPAWWCPARA